MVLASDDERPFYLKHSRDSMADNSAEISKNPGDASLYLVYGMLGFFF